MDDAEFNDQVVALIAWGEEKPIKLKLAEAKKRKDRKAIKLLQEKLLNIQKSKSKKLDPSKEKSLCVDYMGGIDIPKLAKKYKIKSIFIAEILKRNNVAPNVIDPELAAIENENSTSLIIRSSQSFFRSWLIKNGFKNSKKPKIFERLVLGCIDANFYNQILVLIVQQFSRNTQFTSCRTA